MSVNDTLRRFLSAADACAEPGCYCAPVDRLAIVDGVPIREIFAMLEGGLAEIDYVGPRAVDLVLTPAGIAARNALGN